MKRPLTGSAHDRPYVCFWRLAEWLGLAVSGQSVLVGTPSGVTLTTTGKRTRTESVAAPAAEMPAYTVAVLRYQPSTSCTVTV